MRRAGIISCLLAYSAVGLAQTTIVKPLTGVIKNQDILIQAVDRKTVLVEQFTLFFRTQHSFQEPSMGIMLKAKLDLDPKLAIEITDAALVYFKEAFAQKSISVESIAKDVFLNNIDIKKADKRGDPWLVTGGTTEELKDKETEDTYLAVHANGVNYSPIIRKTIIGTFDTAVASTVAFLEVINFSDPDSPSKKGKYAGSPIITPRLMLDSAETMCGTGGIGFWNRKLKGGSVSFPNNPEIVWEGPAWLAATKPLDEPNAQLWVLNRDEFKRAVLELSKAETDQYISEYMKAIKPSEEQK